MTSDFINWLLPSSNNSFKVVIDMATEFMGAILNWMSMIINFIVANPMMMIFLMISLVSMAFVFFRRVLRVFRA